MKTSSHRGFEFLAHTADIKVRAWGKTLARCAAEVARGMQTAMFEGKLPSLRKPASVRTIRVCASSPPDLLIDFLNELIAVMDERNEVYPRVEVDTGDGKCWRARLEGGNPARKPRLEVKAATYNALTLERRRGKWVAEVVFDV
jgi:SHS2 domain-containing protein